jgi:ABC1 atypical kinase-like domain
VRGQHGSGEPSTSPAWRGAGASFELCGRSASSARVGRRPRARAFREALEELGTTYIKLGQLLSSGPDLLPDVCIDELARLVDDVPPVPFEQIEAVIHEDLDADLFRRIDPAPLATASIAQIHRALLANGRAVAVKVRRPGIVEQVEQISTCCERPRGCSTATPRPRSSARLRARAPEKAAALPLAPSEVDPCGRGARRSAAPVAALRDPAAAGVLTRRGRPASASHRHGRRPPRVGDDPVGVVPSGLEATEHVLRSVANRVGAALIIVGLLVASALMASVSHWIAGVGFIVAFVLALYMLWKIIRTPGEL